MAIRQLLILPIRLAAADPGTGEDSDADTETALIDPGDPEPVPA